MTFSPNGGGFDDEGEAVRDVEKGAAVGELPVPSRLGYNFGGWWTAKTKGTKITAKTKVTKNVTYYARWTVRKYKVSAAVSAKAAGSVSGAGTKTFNSKVTLKAAAKKGYVFVKWVDLNDEETPWPSAVKCRQPSVTFAVLLGGFCRRDRLHARRRRNRQDLRPGVEEVGELATIAASCQSATPL